MRVLAAYIPARHGLIYYLYPLNFYYYHLLHLLRVSIMHLLHNNTFHLKQGGVI